MNNLSAISNGKPYGFEQEFEQYELLSEFEVSGSRKTPAYIKWLQTSLNQLLGLNLAADGIMGTNTRSAIRSFQRKNGLDPDGIVGVLTERALGKALAEKVTGIGTSLLNTAANIYCDTVNKFEFDKDRILPFHMPTLERIARSIVNSYKTTSPVTTVNITGHTDKVGDDPYNDALGQRRGEAVRNYLKQAIEKLKPGFSFTITFNVSSKGEREAIFTNRAENRRVVICYPPATIQPPTPIPIPTPTPPAPTALAITCSSPYISPGPTSPLPVSIPFIISLANRLLSNPLLQLIAGYRPPTMGRFLDAYEIAAADKVFNGSLDFSKIIITNGNGFGKSYFTLAIPIAGATYIIIMMGSVCSWVKGQNSTHILIHELTHAWQSQHHRSNPQAFMFNSVKCQAAALAFKLLLAQAQNPIFPFLSSIDVSAYAYMPGKNFDQYAVEQIAQQVEDDYLSKTTINKGFPNPKIMNIIQSVGPYARSIPNENCMGVTGLERNDTPGVKFR
jgi:outer membrane protein OmpA-like peptidoglycan-associated protein